MDFLKEYNKPFQNRITIELIIAILLSGAITFNTADKIAWLLWFLGIFFLLDTVLIRLDKLIKLGGLT